jgi:glycosyltransferase involved in cell wall biosynthesis
MSQVKLVSITRVRNEIDIIEPFVRHHAQYIDTLIIVDDGSIDGTHEVLLALQAEGLPLEISRDPVVGYEQSFHMSRLLRWAIKDFAADWVVPLDADEFIEPPAGKSLADVLREHTPDLYSIPWVNFAWSPASDFGNERNPVTRQRHRFLPSRTHHKVLVPAHLINANAELSQYAR